MICMCQFLMLSFYKYGYIVFSLETCETVADLICPLYSLCNLAFTAFNFGNFIFPVSKSTAIFPFVKFVVYDLWLSCLLLNFGYPACSLKNFDMQRPCYRLRWSEQIYLFLLTIHSLSLILCYSNYYNPFY